MITKNTNISYDPLAQVRTYVKCERTINEETGEVSESKEKHKRPYGSHYWRNYREDYLKCWGRVSIYCEDVFCILFKKMNGKDNTCYMTQEKIAKACNKKIGAVKRALKELQDADIIKKIRNGQYMINPSMYVFDMSDGGELQKALIRRYDPLRTEEIQADIDDTLHWRLYRKEYIQRWETITIYCRDIFCLILENMHPGDNICYITQEEIAKVSGDCRTTVRRKLKALFDADIIRMVKKGQYMINPYIYVYSTNTGNKQRNILIRYYNAMQPPRIKNHSIMEKEKRKKQLHQSCKKEVT